MLPVARCHGGESAAAGISPFVDNAKGDTPDSASTIENLRAARAGGYPIAADGAGRASPDSDSDSDSDRRGDASWSSATRRISTPSSARPVYAAGITDDELAFVVAAKGLVGLFEEESGRMRSSAPRRSGKRCLENVRGFELVMMSKKRRRRKRMSVVVRSQAGQRAG